MRYIYMIYRNFIRLAPDIDRDNDANNDAAKYK